MPRAQPLIFGKSVSALLLKYYFGPDHPAKLRLWNWFFRALHYPRLQMPYGEKGRISVDLRDVLQLWLVRDGEYESEVWLAISAYLREGDIFWDVGAHVGIVAVLAQQDARIRELHCFEAHPETFRALKANLSLNQGTRWKAHAFALGDRVEKRTLFGSPKNNQGLSSFVPTGVGKEEEVPCWTADALIAKGEIPAPTLMKIDVEGWELPVLQGAETLFVKSPPRAVVFEAECDEQGTIRDRRLVVWFEERGYRIEHITRPGKSLNLRENYLAIHATAGGR